MSNSEEFINKSVDTIRFLSADGVQQANSGHPGLPMGAAAIAYTIWTRHLRHNPANPAWHNRDRFILSGGHGSMLLYSLLYLTGYDLNLDELKSFRQWGSRTPGHPEYGLTPGVEITTGPLGQGFANGIGMAIAETHLASLFNKPDYPLIDHFTYAIVTDGDLMEGVASEAASLAGHLELGKLIYLYDDNRISIDGSTDLAFTEDRATRFSSYGWHVLHVDDGNNVEAIDQAIIKAKQDPRPSLIICRTQIGYRLPTRQGTSKAHGEPPGDEELNGAKSSVNFPLEPRFYVPDDVLEFFRQARENGEKFENDWQMMLDRYQQEYPGQAVELNRRLTSQLPANFENDLPEFPADAKGMATRASSGKVINALSANLPELVGGSADLTPSNNNWINCSESYQADHRSGRNIHYGVREHAMAAIINGMAVHKGVIPFGATFFVFSDYMRPSIRVSALSHIRSIWALTHDSIGLGEDGPTHQPIEQLASLRAMPNLNVIRPCDANEVQEAWKSAIKRKDGPTILVLSRQATPTIDRVIYHSASGLQHGAYILADLGAGTPRLILMASGTEVPLIIEAAKVLADEGIPTRIVSFPSWELFENQDQTYKESVLPPQIVYRLAVEAGVSQGWEKWVGCKGSIIGINTFGASAPYKILMDKYGFSVHNVIQRAKELLES